MNINNTDFDKMKSQNKKKSFKGFVFSATVPKTFAFLK